MPEADRAGAGGAEDDGLDADRLDRLCEMIGRAGFETLIRTLLEDLAGRRRQLGALAAAGDLPTLAREAHRLRGTVGSYGFARVAALTRDLEAACADADQAAMAAALDQLLTALDAGMTGVARRFGAAPPG